MKPQALTDIGLFMASIFLSISCVYMLVMLAIRPRVQARVPLSQGVIGFTRSFPPISDCEGYRGWLQGQGTGKRLPMVHPGDSYVVGLTDTK